MSSVASAGRVKSASLAQLRRAGDGELVEAPVLGRAEGDGARALHDLHAVEDAGLGEARAFEGVEPAPGDENGRRALRRLRDEPCVVAVAEKVAPDLRRRERREVELGEGRVRRKPGLRFRHPLLQRRAIDAEPRDRAFRDEGGPVERREAFEVERAGRGAEKAAAACHRARRPQDRVVEDDAADRGAADGVDRAGPPPATTRGGSAMGRPLNCAMKATSRASSMPIARIGS